METGRFDWGWRVPEATQGWQKRGRRYTWLSEKKSEFANAMNLLKRPLQQPIDAAVIQAVHALHAAVSMCICTAETYADHDLAWRNMCFPTDAGTLILLRVHATRWSRTAIQSSGFHAGSLSSLRVHAVVVLGRLVLKRPRPNRLNNRPSWAPW